MQKKLILASQSPRRKELLQQAGYQFSTQSLQVEEDFPADVPLIEVAAFLAQKKAAFLKPQLTPYEVAITADTTVILGNELLEKAADLEEARQFLHKLSGNCHQVITGVCVFDHKNVKVFSVETKVYFKNLSLANINHYVNSYQPLDKAGAYGIQEWIGLVGIQKIEGSYHNVVGLPVSQLFDILEEFEISPQIV